MTLVYLVIAMAIVTYIPRMVPLVLLQHIRMPSYLSRFMEFIPYAALSALIFPGILYSTGGHFESAIAGGSIAVLLAIKKCNLILIVGGGIVGTFLINILFV
jgi:branched-subunit amino acid transport protein